MQALCSNAFELCKQENSNGDSQVKAGTEHGDTGSRRTSGGEDGDGSAVEKSAEPVFHACNVQIYVAGNHLWKSRVRTLL